MASDYDNLRLGLLAFDRVSEVLEFRIDVDHLWSEIYELAAVSGELLAQAGEVPVGAGGVRELAARLEERLDPETHDFRLCVERVGGESNPVVPIRLLEHKCGGHTHTSCDPSLWEPVYFAPGGPTGPTNF
jgi:hypothetical protein